MYSSRTPFTGNKANLKRYYHNTLFKPSFLTKKDTMLIYLPQDCFVTYRKCTRSIYSPLNLCEIENKKNLSKSKIKEIEENLYELEKRLSELKRYYDYDEINWKGIGDAGNLFNQSTNEKDYYKPIRTTSGFHNKNKYIEYESKGHKSKKFIS